MGWANTGSNRSNFEAFVERLAELDWVEGRSVHIEQRWTDANVERAREFAKELVSQQPAVLFSGTTPATVALSRETQKLPIVFAIVSDPVGAKLVSSLARPGGNITGFINEEAAMGGKWLELIKLVAPDIKYAAIMFNPDTAPGGGNYFLDSFEAAARVLALESTTFRVRSDSEIETAIESFGVRQTGLVLMTDSYMDTHRLTVIEAAKRKNIPTIFDTRSFADDGGLMTYGSNFPDIFRRAASQVDRILRGAKPADLPVELPVKLDLVINLKTAKTLGLTIPPSLLATADKVIE
jgi:putative ABC transport system substrate-binding protein